MTSEHGAAPVPVRVHTPGDHSLDGILRLIEVAGSNRPIEERLSRMCEDVAAITGADVVSCYVREGVLLTMRGNIGFAPSALGTTLQVGEGITGFVAECLRPVSTEVAAKEAHYKHVPGLGEERFPAFLAVPILHGGSAGGVLVLQRRRAVAFTPAEVALAAALAAPFALALDHAARVDHERRRAVRLTGIPHAAGAAMGRAICLPTLASLAAGARDVPPERAESAVARGLDRLANDLDRARAAERLSRGDDPEVARALANLELVLHDRRFNERARAAATEHGLLGGLTAVAREYARVPYRTASGTGDTRALLGERAREVEDLCVLIWTRAQNDRFVHQGSVLVAGHVGAFVALCASSRGAGALISADPLAAPSAAAIAAAAGIPLISDVCGLFSWVRPDDLVVVEGDGGAVHINPAASTVARFRRDRAG